ncbi:MAG: SGNH/GDSL hydrolase family protein [Eubacterium sp.]|nr:SGNH/GDSL hydrolase family protein [Eubacterium sp.]
MSYFKERINKRLLIHSIQAVAFFLIVAFLLFALSFIFMPKTNKDLRDKSANGILAEPAGTIDVVIVGDSESFCSFIPLQLWNDYGITSYVCGTPMQTLDYSADFLRKAFENQKPKLVVLETNAIFREFSFKSAVLLRADEKFSIYRYHDRWKKLSLSDFSSNVENNYIENDKGYRIYDGVKSGDTSSYMKPSDEKEKIPVKNKPYLQNIMQLCEENGAELMFVSTPSIKNWNSARHNTMIELTEELGVEYMDMNVLNKEVPIDWTSDTYDAGDHLNHVGAKKATAYFGEYIHSKNILEDHRNDNAYSDWNKAYSNFLVTVEKSKLQAKIEA